MSALAIPLFGWFPKPMELRIDVRLHPDDVDAELEKLYRRFRTPGDRLHRIGAAPGPAPGLVFRHRESDGEHYVYVEDVVHRRLAGYTVFNRLLELSRRADPHLRAPHSRYGTRYQRRGIASAVYEWALGSGMCLISGPRQSAGAHALWRALANRHELGYVDLRDRRLEFLGPRVRRETLDEFHTRMVLLGRGWTFEELMQATGAGPE
jgi:hypothetical protein